MKNPFAPGTGILPPYLAGRKEEIEGFKKELKASLALPRNILIKGIRGTGKTVLLIQFEKICESQKWLFVRREFNRENSRTNDLVTGLLTDIITKTGGLLTSIRTTKRKIGFLSEETKELTAEEIIAGVIDKTHGTIGDKLEEIFSVASLAIRKAGFKGLVFLYDEFHNFEDGAGEYPLSLLLEVFSHLQQKGHKYFLALSGLPPLHLNLIKAKTYAERMFVVWPIKELAPDDAKEAMLKPLAKAGIKFSNELINRLILETKGYPYLIQFYCYYILRNIPKKKIALKEYEAIYPMLLKSLDESFFIGRFLRASEVEQGVLFAMAKVGEAFRPIDLLKHLKISKSDLNIRIYSLINKNLIYKISRGKYTFALPAFKEFLEREARK